MIERLTNLVAELRERRAIRLLIGYVVGAAIAVQAAGFFVEQGYVGRTVLDVSLYLALVFFLLTVVLVWYHGEQGQQRVRRAEGVLIGALLVIAAGGSVWIASRERGPSRLPVRAIHDLGDNSVAVLPFQNQIMLSDYAWLDRGIAELLATDLSQFDTLRVVSGQRVLDVLRQLGVDDSRVVPPDLQSEVTRLAGARYMLTGSLVGSPDDLQLVASLSDTRTGDIRASSRARGDDVFAVVDEVSAAISSELTGHRIDPIENVPVARLTTNSLEAFRAYDAGRQAAHQFLTEDARKYFEQAIELDPTYAAAHFHLAGLEYATGNPVAANASMQAAARHAEAASERDRLAIGAFSAFIAGDSDEGERSFRELIGKYPYDKDARLIYASMALQGIVPREEAERQYSEILTLDPYDGEALYYLASISMSRDDLARADSLIERYVAAHPSDPKPLWARGQLRMAQGRHDQALADHLRALDIRAYGPAMAHVALSYAREQQYDEARAWLAPYKAAESPETRVAAWWLSANSHLWEGDIPRALAVYDSLIVVAASAGPDLYYQALDGLLETLMLLERYPEASDLADSLRRVRGSDASTMMAGLHYLGSTGRFDEMEQMRAEVVGNMRAMGTPESIFNRASRRMDIVIAFHRGDHSRVVRLATEPRDVPAGEVLQWGYPSIRSAVETGDAASARRLFADFFSLARAAPEFTNAPLQGRIHSYLAGRIAELEGDTVAAVRRYTDLIESWSLGIRHVPMVRDVRERRDALARGAP